MRKIYRKVEEFSVWIEDETFLLKIKTPEDFFEIGMSSKTTRKQFHDNAILNIFEWFSSPIFFESGYVETDILMEKEIEELLLRIKNDWYRHQIKELLKILLKDYKSKEAGKYRVLENDFGPKWFK